MKGKIIAVKHFLSGRRYKVRWENGYVGSVSPGYMRQDTTASLPRYQLETLQYAAQHGPLDSQSAAQADALQLTPTALGTVINALQRRGLLEPDGSINAVGVATLVQDTKEQVWPQGEN